MGWLLILVRQLYQERPYQPQVRLRHKKLFDLVAVVEVAGPDVIVVVFRPSTPVLRAADLTGFARLGLPKLLPFYHGTHITSPHLFFYSTSENFLQNQFN
jgi:hypothetical protein